MKERRQMEVEASIFYRCCKYNKNMLYMYLFSITNIYMKTTSKIINKTTNKKRNYVFSI